MISADNNPIAAQGVTEAGQAHHGLLNNLASDARIKSAKNAAVALTFQELLRSDMANARQGWKELGEGISKLQASEQAIREFGSTLEAMKRMATQAGAATSSSEQKATLQQQFNALGGRLAQIAETTTVNGTSLFAKGETIKIDLGDGRTMAIDTQSITIDSTDLSTAPAAAQTQLDGAITQVERFSKRIGTKLKALESLAAAIEMKVENVFTEALNIPDAAAARKTTSSIAEQIVGKPQAAAEVHSDSIQKIVAMMLD